MEPLRRSKPCYWGRVRSWDLILPLEESNLVVFCKEIKIKSFKFQVLPLKNLCQNIKADCYTCLNRLQYPCTCFLFLNQHYIGQLLSMAKNCGQCSVSTEKPVTGHLGLSLASFLSPCPCSSGLSSGSSVS